MIASFFDGVMARSGIPAVLRVFGVPATHANADQDEVAVTVILRAELVPVGDYGERMDARTTLRIAKTHNARVGDTFAIENTPTEDDPEPDPTPWTATQLLADDGYFHTFVVRSDS